MIKVLMFVFAFVSVSFAEEGRVELLTTTATPNGVYYYRQPARRDIVTTYDESGGSTTVKQLIFGQLIRVKYKFTCHEGFPMRAYKTKSGAWSVYRDTASFEATREDNVGMIFPLSMKPLVCTP